MGGRELVWSKGEGEGQATCRQGRIRVRRAAVRRIEGSMAMDGPQLAGARADPLPLLRDGVWMDGA